MTTTARATAYESGPTEVWVSSLDGLKKARLSGPVVNASGETENWLAVAASDGGRIVAVRNKPGGSRASPGSRSGSRTARRRSSGRLTTRAAGSLPVYPLGFDVTADGAHMV